MITRKVTKAERKAKGRNAAVARSLRDGRIIKVGEATYRGSTTLPWVRSYSEFVPSTS